MADAVMRNLPAPAKLNLNLRVVGRRRDGMHLLEGESVLLTLGDRVTLRERTDGVIARAWRHPQVGDDDDLCLRAARLLRETCGASALGVSIGVDKVIPVGGGLGGASSNAATVLMGLNRLWRLNLTKKALTALAATLGADVAFFLFGGAARIGGVGEPLSALKIGGARHYLLVFPAAAALTAAVYAEYHRLTKTVKLGRMPFPLEKSENDLTLPAARLYPSLVGAARALRQVAPEARLSGSGSTVFAAFSAGVRARRAQAGLPEGTRSAVTSILRRHPLCMKDENETNGE